ncbi:hypothetical protein [Arthrobacter sp. HMWF013]|nr:hypothetical protein [Arthrobacter sp. HMWF013]
MRGIEGSYFHHHRRLEHRTGILISRIGLDRYIVRAHPGVPYGLIREAF